VCEGIHSRPSKLGRPPIEKQPNWKIFINRGVGGSGIGRRRLSRPAALALRLKQALASAAAIALVRHRIARRAARIVILRDYSAPSSPWHK